MNNELTQSDIDKMNEEIHYRKHELEPKLLEAVKEARELGDLSENDEYRSAKRDLNSNRRRVRYLEGMIKTAIIVKPNEDAEVVSLYDVISLHYVERNMDRDITLVTTVRNDVLNDCISSESPLGKALIGKRLGDTVKIEVNAQMTYNVVITAIKKSAGESDIPIKSF